MLTLTACVHSPVKIDPEYCPQELQAAVEQAPRVPDAAGIPGARTPEQQEKLASYLTWLTSYAGHDKELMRRLEAGRKWCLERLPK